MAFYRVNLVGGVSLIRQAGTIAAVTARARQQHPEGIQSVDLLTLQDLSAVLDAGFSLPVRARAAASKHLRAERRMLKALEEPEDHAAQPEDPEVVRKRTEKDAARVAREKLRRAAKAKAAREANKRANEAAAAAVLQGKGKEAQQGA